MIGRINEIIFSQSLASGALNNSYYFNEDGTVQVIYLKFSTSITETVTITRTSAAGGSNYDIVVATENLSGATSYIFHPCYNLVLKKGDNIKIQCTNANVTGTVYGTLHFEAGINE